VDILIGKLTQNLRYAMRELGYIEIQNRKTRETSYERPLQGMDYPRFHIYLSFTENNLVLKLHLDQKKPSYEGTSAHNGEYSGPLLEAEAERIKNILKTN